MQVLHLKKCLLLCRAHSYIPLRVLLCISPWSGLSCSASLFPAGFSPFILAHVIWKKTFITRITKKEGPGGVKQDAAVKRGRSFMFLVRDFAASFSGAVSEVSNVRGWTVTQIHRPPPHHWLSVKQKAMQILSHFLPSPATVHYTKIPWSSAFLLHRVISSYSQQCPRAVISRALCSEVTQALSLVIGALACEGLDMLGRIFLEEFHRNLSERCFWSRKHVLGRGTERRWSHQSGWKHDVRTTEGLCIHLPALACLQLAN